MCAVTALPKWDNPSISLRPSSALPAWDSRGSEGRSACWSVGGFRAGRSNVCRWTNATSSIHGWTLSWRARPSVTAIRSRPPGRRCPRRRARGGGDGAGDAEATPVGLLKFDLARDEIASWSPGPGATPSEPLFVRALDGHGDDEGWLLTVVDDVNRGASDLYVLDASALGGAAPRRSSTCRRDCRCAATGSGCRPTGIAERPVAGTARATNRFCRSRRHAATVQVCMAPTLVKDGPRPASVSRRTDALVSSVTQHHRAISAHQSQLLEAVAELDQRRAWRGRRRHVDGGLARPAMRRLCGHRTRMGHRGRQASVAAQNRRRARRRESSPSTR